MQFGKSGKDDSIPPSTPSAESSAGSGTGQSSSGTSLGKLEAFLGKGSKVVGNLTFTGPVELDGFVEGEIHAQDRITIGEGAVVNGRILGGEVVIKGSVNGDINASKRLSLKKPAKIIGNISSTNLSIEEGVVFEGKCMMGSGATQSSGAGAVSSGTGTTSRGENLQPKTVPGGSVVGNAGKLGASI